MATLCLCNTALRLAVTVLRCKDVRDKQVACASNTCMTPSIVHLA